MITKILGIPEHHGFSTLPLHLEYHREKMADHRHITISTSDVPLYPYIDRGAWVADCACVAGVAVEPTWEHACCFGCGTIHRVITFPDDRAQIEAVLLRRRHHHHRNWHPQKGELLEDLLRENAENPDLLEGGAAA